MLNFDTQGYLIPQGNILSTVLELEQTFKINPARTSIYSNYQVYIDDLKKIIGKEIKQWVDGSYVTKNILPNDIDLVTFLDYDDYEKHQSQLTDFFYPYSKKAYNIDAYIIIVYPPEHKNHFYYRSDRAEWMHNFSKDFKTNHKKGFLEITI